MLTSLLLALTLAHGQTSAPEVTTVSGEKITLQGRTGTVLLFMEPTCPIARDYQPTLKRMQKSLQQNDVMILGVIVNPNFSAEEAKAWKKEYKITYPVTIDRTHTLVRKYGAKISPECVLLDRKGTVRYQGRIDDRFPELGTQREPKTHELADAIASIIAGSEVKVKSMPAVGCVIPSLKDYDGTQS